MTHNDFCTNCGADVTRYKKIVSSANVFYNEGLEKASVRDLSGAIDSLRQCLKLDKSNVDARNLLGLVYFEIGEYVAALNEWVISKNLRPSKNIADDYLSMLQDNPTKLDTYSQAVKKYNQALSYCYQGTLDLAIIQLKKVLSLNPKYVQAHQLLALLYLNAEQWEDARKILLRCQKVDVNNTLTLRYLREAQLVLNVDEETSESKSKSHKLDSIKGKREKNNDLYAPTIGMKETRTISTVINVVIGIAIGVAVAYLLILPAKVTSAKDGMEEKLKAVNEQLDSKTAEITQLEQNIKTAQSEKDALSSELKIYVGQDGSMTAMDNLLSAISKYLENPEDKAAVATYLDQIDSTALDQASESFVNVYNEILGKVGGDVGSTYYDSGVRAYQNESYADAIADLTKAYAYDNNNADALYILAEAYRKSGDTINAIDMYQEFVDKFPDNENAPEAQKNINDLNND